MVDDAAPHHGPDDWDGDDLHLPPSVPTEDPNPDGAALEGEDEDGSDAVR